MGPRRPRRWLAHVALAYSLAFSPAHAFQINPNKTPNDSRLANLAGMLARVANKASERLLGLFKAPVHEAVTHAAFGCDLVDPLACVTGTHAPAGVIWGLRWNDDPPFRMRPARARCHYEQTIRSNTQPTCWYELFTHAEREAATGAQFGPGHALLYRSHFGDLQFLHAMATRDDEPPQLTQSRIMMWAEFAWGIATGALRRDRYISTLGVPELGSYFPGEQSASILFALGNPAFQNEKVREVALGSLLHVVQDSFSRAHVTRGDPSGAECPGFPGSVAPGLIVQFQSYVKQDHALHDQADRADALRLQLLESNPHVVSVSSNLVEMWKRNAPWPEAKAYLECVFSLSASARPAGPGEGFNR
jgi:hypothetical protein